VLVNRQEEQVPMSGDPFIAELFRLDARFSM
jgi:hypothetical protein